MDFFSFISRPPEMNSELPTNHELLNGPIERMTTQNLKQILNDTLGKEVFTKFLEDGSVDDESEALKLLKCYDLCVKFLSNDSECDKLDMLERILYYCPSHFWEYSKQNKKHRREDIQTILRKLRNECIKSLQNHSDFLKFKKYLLEDITKQ